MNGYMNRVLDLAMSIGRRGRWGPVALLALAPVMAVHADVIADRNLVATNTINGVDAHYLVELRHRWGDHGKHKGHDKEGSNSHH